MIKYFHYKNLILFSFAFIALIPSINIYIQAIFLFSVSCLLVLKFMSTKFRVESVIILFFILYLITTWLIGFSVSSFGRLFNFLFIFISFVICLEFSWSKNSIDKLCYFVYYLSVTSFLIQIYILIDNPLILYQLNYIDPSERPMFLGNTIYVMFLVFVGYLLCFYCDISRNKKFLIFSLSIIYVILAGKTTTLLLYFFLLFCTLVSISSLKLKLITLLTCCIFISLVYYFELLPIYVLDRIHALYSLFFASSSYSSDLEFLERFNLMSISLESFYQNPIFGLGGNYINFKGDFDLVKNSGIGHHSELIDFLARFGLVGLFFLSFTIISVFRKYFLSSSYFIFFSLTMCLWLILNNAVTVNFAFLILFFNLLLYREKFL